MFSFKSKTLTFFILVFALVGCSQADDPQSSTTVSFDDELNIFEALKRYEDCVEGYCRTIKYKECSDKKMQLVSEEIDWHDLPNTTRIDFAQEKISSKFITTDSKKLVGSIAFVPATAMGHVSRRVWISKCPGGKPLKQKTIDGEIDPINFCEVEGTQPQLNWTQVKKSTDRTACKLKRNRVYYLNYKNLNCDSSNCSMYRSMGSRELID